MYLPDPDTPYRIAATYPGTVPKIIAVLREPVARALSHWRFADSFVRADNTAHHAKTGKWRNPEAAGWHHALIGRDRRFEDSITAALDEYEACEQQQQSETNGLTGVALWARCSNDTGPKTRLLTYSMSVPRSCTELAHTRHAGTTCSWSTGGASSRTTHSASSVRWVIMCARTGCVSVSDACRRMR